MPIRSSWIVDKIYIDYGIRDLEGIIGSYGAIHTDIGQNSLNIFFSVELFACMNCNFIVTVGGESDVRLRKPLFCWIRPTNFRLIPTQAIVDAPD